MSTQSLPGGTVHTLPADLRKALLADQAALAAWQTLTTLARNEWICWVEGAKLIETRERRVERTHTELAEGMRRPCCWPGCMHRTDKQLSPSQKFVLERQTKKTS